jgi:putative flippase GtrA
MWIEGTVDQVKYLRDTYARYAQRIHEIAKFGVVGSIGFIVQLGVTDGVHLGLGVGALTAVIVGYVVATVVTFLGNRHWAFKHRQGKGLSHETLMFVMLNVVGLGIQEAVVATVHYGLHMTDPLSYNVANILGIGLGTLFRLWSYRKWVFLEVNEEPAEIAPTVLPAELPAEEHSAPAHSHGMHAAGAPSAHSQPSQAAPGRHRAPEGRQPENESGEIYPQPSIG